MRSYDKILYQLTNIRRWLYTTIFAYNHANTTLIDQINNGENTDSIVFSAFNEKGCSTYGLIHRLKTENIKICKELSLIKCISALEVFLVDSIKEVFDTDISPFLSNDKIEFHLGEVLSCNDISQLKQKYIANRCRNLHSCGFEEIGKYYKKIFSIDFSHFSTTINDTSYGIAYIQRYHQMRHLITHQLGKTDEQYRKKYATTDTVIKLSEDDLSIFFKVMESFSHYIYSHLQVYFTTPVFDNKIEVKIEIIDPEVKSIFEPNYKFRLKKNIEINLSSILEQKIYDSNFITLRLHGTFPVMRKYYKNLRKQESAGKIKIVSYNTISLADKNKSFKKYSWADVEKVIELLPEQPWEKYIHKKIAAQLGWSNNKVSGIIQNIIRESPSSLAVKPKNKILHIGDTFRLEVIFEDSFKGDIEWKTSNSNVATVSDGIITAISEGCAFISAKISSSTNYSICSLTVIS